MKISLYNARPDQIAKNLPTQPQFGGIVIRPDSIEIHKPTGWENFVAKFSGKQLNVRGMLYAFAGFHQGAPYIMQVPDTKIAVMSVEDVLADHDGEGIKSHLRELFNFLLEPRAEFEINRQVVQRYTDAIEATPPEAFIPRDKTGKPDPGGTVKINLMA